MTLLECATAPLFETGTEPEYFVTHIAKIEQASDGCLRLYLASERGRDHQLRLEFTAVVAVARLAVMAREALAFAADSHNVLMWQDAVKPGH